MNHEPKTSLPWNLLTLSMGMDNAVDLPYIVHTANAYPRLVAALQQIARDLTISNVDRCMAVAEFALQEVGEL